MVTTSLQGASRPRVRATVVGTLIAFTVASCSGGKRVDEGTTSRTGAVIAVAPGAETPLTDLVMTVEGANAKLSALLSAMGSELADNAADDVTLIAAQLANAAADAIDQTDERELEQNAAKMIEAAAAAAHGAAAGMVDAAGKATDPDDGADRVATFAAAVAGAHTAAVAAAEAAADLAGRGDICGSKAGLKQALDSAAAAAGSARSAAEHSAALANQFAAGTEGLLAQDAAELAASLLDGGPSATELAAALASVSAALDRDPAGVPAGIDAVKQKAAAHKSKIQTFADKVVKIAQDGAPDGNAEANAKAAKAGAGDADRKCAAARKDVIKKLASKKAAANTAGAALAIAKKRHIKTRSIETRKKLAKVAEEANKAAGKGANGAAKAGEDLREMEADIAAKRARKRKIAKAATAMHIVSAGMAHGAAKMMDEAAPDDDADSAADLGAMVASMQSAMDSLADAAGEVAEGEGIETELGEMLEMVTAAATANNTAAEQFAIVAELTEGAIENDQELKTKLQDLKEAAKDKATRKDVAKKAADAARKHAIKGGDPTGAGTDMKTAVNADKGKSKVTGEKAEAFAGRKQPDGNAESISKTAAGHAGDAPEKCGGVRKDKLRKLTESMAAAHTTKAALAAAKKKAAKDKTADARKKAAEAAAEANKASAHLANAAAEMIEGARDAEPDAAKAEQFEGTATAMHTFAAGLADVASKVMDEDVDDGLESVAELMAGAASARAAVNRMMDVVADAIVDEPASPDVGELLQMVAAAAASANTATDQVADVAEMIEAVVEDSAMAQALADFKLDARDKQSRQESMRKTAEASRKLSDATKDPTGAAGEMKGAAQFDKQRARATADKAAGAAGAVKPGGNSEQVSKTASAGASDAPSVCSSAKEDAVKRLASSMAGARTAAASLAAAHKKAQKQKTAAAFGKLAAAKAEAHKAASQLGNAAEMTMEGVSEIGLAVDRKEQIEDAIASAHAAAAAMSAAAGETATDDAAACGEAPISDLAGMLAAVRGASNALAQSSADVATGLGASAGIGHVLQMTTMSMVSADTAGDDVADTADDMSAKTQDAAKKQVLDTFKLTARDKQTSREATKKSADAARKHSDASKDPTGAAGEMKQAAQFDKPKTKETAAAAGGAAQKYRPNGSGESMSKIAEAGADDVPSKCGSVTKEGMKRLASAKAAADTAAMNLAAAMKKKQRKQTAGSQSKLAAAKAEAHKASSKLGIEAAKAMEMVSEIGGGASAAATKRRKIRARRRPPTRWPPASPRPPTSRGPRMTTPAARSTSSEFGAVMASIRRPPTM